jgi:hypothetical protein
LEAWFEIWDKNAVKISRTQFHQLNQKLEPPAEDFDTENLEEVEIEFD